MKDVKYAVYGYGNRDWVSTFHKIPKLLDSKFKENGAICLVPTGLGDVAAGDISMTSISGKMRLSGPL